MPPRVTITTGARLHFGLLTGTSAEGLRFGGAGVMVDAPGFELTLQPASADEFRAPDVFADRIAALTTRFRRDSNRDCPALRVDVVRSIPSHRGLGSGTQLELAVLAGLLALAGEQSPSTQSVQQHSRRGRRSQIGMHGFAQGGFFVDPGRSESETSQELTRAKFPEAWRFLLATPSDQRGLFGRAEAEAFAKLPPMPGETVARLTTLLRERLLPAVRSADFDTCSETLYEYGMAIGRCFAPVQGGPFASRQMLELADSVRGRGIRGVAQTSWGPTIAILCPDETTGQSWQRKLEGDRTWADCEFQLVGPLNCGARVVVSQ